MKSTGIRKRIFDIIQIGNKTDVVSVLFDYFIVFNIIANIGATVLETFDEMAPYMGAINVMICLTSIIFCGEYILRVWTADLLYPALGQVKGRLRFILSFYGLIDLFSFLPYFVPGLLTSGVVAFRILRVIRIFHLFRINAQYDAFNVVLDVLNEKRQQLFSSISLIMIMMLASSLCMYNLEHEAQPEVFANAFSGIWWSMSTLLTVGYGDIYPITLAGKIMAILIAFLGVGLVAIPTGIISAGFVEQYTKIKSLSEVTYNNDLRFIMLTIEPGHPWEGARIRDISLPPELIVVVIVRKGDQLLIPNGDTHVKPNDRLVLGALEFADDIGLQLKEISIRKGNPWIDKRVSQLDLPEESVLVSIFRDGHNIIPHGKTTIQKGDLVVVCEKDI
ncbi:MAG: ion transporter [Eubacterium sp.]|nr:ion transporter [Eubacterium sp.]